MSNKVPLADRLRPENFDDFVGQEHIFGENKIFEKILENNSMPNMILYGPPGVGKTTLAMIISKKTNKKFFKLNATTCSISDIKDIIKNTNI